MGKWFNTWWQYVKRLCMPKTRQAVAGKGFPWLKTLKLGCHYWKRITIHNITLRTLPNLLVIIINSYYLHLRFCVYIVAFYWARRPAGYRTMPEGSREQTGKTVQQTPGKSFAKVWVCYTHLVCRLFIVYICLYTLNHVWHA